MSHIYLLVGILINPYITVYIPASVTHLTFGRYFNQPINIGTIPANVTHLSFCEKFNQPIYPGTIPANVTHLSFGQDFNQPYILVLYCKCHTFIFWSGF